MTCIVGIEHEGKVYMGADSCASDHKTKVELYNPKIFIKGNFIFGVCGSFYCQQLIQYRINIPAQPEEVSAIRYLCNTFIPLLQKCFKDNDYNIIKDASEILIGYLGSMYYLYSDFSVNRVSESYAAIGSGEQIALGSLHTTSNNSMEPTARLELALDAASSHGTHVSGPFNFSEL